jgi:hypothetical protein
VVRLARNAGNSPEKLLPPRPRCVGGEAGGHRTLEVVLVEVEPLQGSQGAERVRERAG